MTDTQLSSQEAEALARLWEERYRRQVRIIASITSLLDKYGSSLDLDHLHRAFLLTLMGHYVVGDACYYSLDADDMIPWRSYGRLAVADLPRVPAAGSLATLLLGETNPLIVSAVDERATAELGSLADHVAVIAPLRVKNQLSGFVVLGSKVDGSEYTKWDLDVLHALCAASAMTFNNAVLCGNARLATEEVRKLYRVRYDLISRVSHEFRTPLTVIKGAVELLVQSEANAMLRESLASSVARLEALTEDLLQVKEEAIDEGAEFLTGIAAVQVIDEVVARCWVLALAQEVRLVLRRESGVEHCVISANRKAVSDAVEALVDNAIKYSPPTSTVQVSIGTALAPIGEIDGTPLSDWKLHSRELIAAYDDVTHPTSLAVGGSSPVTFAGGTDEGAAGRYLVVRVSDTGIGIPDAEVALLGEPFGQASNSPEVGVKGRGLGLARVCQAVAHCNGEIFCRSKEGAGTTFSIYFPFAGRTPSPGAR